MMGRAISTISGLCLIFVLFMGFSTIEDPRLEDPRLYINEIKVQESYVQIDYEITFGGFVELHLKNSTGEKIWVKGKVEDTAGNFIFRISRKPLELEKRYSFILKYKGKDYSGSFYNSTSKESE
ncbi:MAG: hypothetical protein AAFR66_11015 [Bacteroidota bacterium]